MAHKIMLSSKLFIFYKYMQNALDNKVIFCGQIWAVYIENSNDRKSENGAARTLHMVWIS